MAGVPGKGGKKGRSGRPKLLEAHKAQRMCQNALMKLYEVESIEEALVCAMNEFRKEPQLMKFFFQHAIGNAPQSIDGTLSNKDGSKLIPTNVIVEVVRTEHNKHVDANKDDNSLRLPNSVE